MTELISTRKQYEETLDFLKINRFAYDEANEIDDLIEALREVVREGKRINKQWQIAIDEIEEPTGALDVHDWIKLMRFSGWPALAEKLDALPDWIKQNG